jgi:hypothetical protein
VRGKDGKINVPLTLLDTAAKAFIPGYGIVRGGMGAINAIFGPTTMTAEEAAAEQASYTALAEANVSPSIPPTCCLRDNKTRQRSKHCLAPLTYTAHYPVRLAAVEPTSTYHQHLDLGVK